jgi:FkbM family methyltransferase
MDLSYTQNMEDYHLSLAFAGQATGTYIDIGAGHPIADNVSFWFYERGWRGIVVEPQPRLIDLYARLRPRDVPVRSLIGDRSGVTDFHVFERFHGLSTTIEQHARTATASGAEYQTVQVPMVTLAELCAGHVVAPIDFLKIDVEGGEASVLRGGDWRRYRPKLVVVEAVTPLSGLPSWEEWEPHLLSQGYRFVLFDTLNRFYVAEEEPEIAARLPSERAPWDAVRHMYEIGRAPENPQHPDHALTRVLAQGFWSVLPHLDRKLLAEILNRGGASRDASGTSFSVEAIDTDEFRARLGRIACGYDGGQVDGTEESQAGEPADISQESPGKLAR